MTLLHRTTSLSSRARMQVAVACVAVATIAATASPAKADLVNLVQNGNFNDTTAYYTYNGVQVGTETTDSNLAAWQFTGCNSSNCGFSFLANSNLASTGWYDQQDGHISTPGANPGALPVAGSNAFMSDADYDTQYMYQSIAGLHVGDSYTLKFWQASFEQSGYTGRFTSSWQVGLANGSPFNAANYVSLTDATNPVNVPEPATLGLTAAGVLGLVAARRRRRAA